MGGWRAPLVGAFGLACLVTLALTTLVLTTPKAEAISAIRLYQHRLSPIAARMGIRCRFTPSCSHYAEVAIERDGVARGGWHTLGRIMRCGPWTPAGTRDEP